MTDRQQDHWEWVYTQKAPAEVSWFQPEARASLAVLERFAAAPSAAFADIGGGASNLVDARVERCDRG